MAKRAEAKTTCRSDLGYWMITGSNLGAGAKASTRGRGQRTEEQKGSEWGDG